jgi:two-component system, OmpR family, sensor histidine kinase KdpD
VIRRNHDAPLTDLDRDRPRKPRGRLKIFFGASIGVGKTYAMLEAARAARAAGIDVVAGYVETHERIETERLLAGLERLAFLEICYRRIFRHEFDLDAALERAPEVLLVDELAHSNVLEGEPRQRHSKRWQDIEELLVAGVDVWTTLNVQHLESLNDVVAGITGVRQKETVPDKIFDEADEIRLIDLSPAELLDRLNVGKVHVHLRPGTDTEAFFLESTLYALREMALRRTADRVDAAARECASPQSASKPWLARDRFLIAVAPDDQAEQLIRVGKRFADALDAEWLVVSVETPAMLKLGEQPRNRRVKALRLAESLGAQTVTLDGPSASAALVEYARLRHVTRIVVGEPRRFGIRALLRPSTASKLVRAGAGFDLSVIARRVPPRKDREPEEATRAGKIHWNRYWAALGISLTCTALAALMYPYLAPANLAMLYLLGATIVALRLGRGPASLSAVMNVLAFDFFFVAPRFSFAVADFEYVITLAVMLLVTLVIANLGASVRAQTRAAGARERRTTLLYRMSRELIASRSLENLVRVAIKHTSEAFGGCAVVLLPDSSGKLHQPRGTPQPGALLGSDISVAQWVFDHGTPAGLGTDTLPGVASQYLPLMGAHRALGVLAVQPSQQRRLLLPEQQHFLETFAAQIALALERADLEQSLTGGGRSSGLPCVGTRGNSPQTAP